MCSIHGIGFQKGHEEINPLEIRKVIARLLVAGQGAGRISTGVAIADEKKITVVKNNLLAEKFVESPEWKKVAARTITKPIQIIGHCRWPTQGSPINNDNNHPIVCERIVGVHNGCIGNDHSLFESHEGDFERIAEVDSEIIFQLINSYNKELQDMADSIYTTSNLITGSYACAAINADNPHVMWLFRNGSPCEIVHFSKGIVMFSTSKSYIEKAVKGVDFGKTKEIKLDVHSGIGINLFNSTFVKFKTKDNEMVSGGYA